MLLLGYDMRSDIKFITAKHLYVSRAMLISFTRSALSGQSSPDIRSDCWLRARRLLRRLESPFFFTRVLFRNCSAFMEMLSKRDRCIASKNQIGITYETHTFADSHPDVCSATGNGN